MCHLSWDGVGLGWRGEDTNARFCDVTSPETDVMRAMSYSVDRERQQVFARTCQSTQFSPIVGEILTSRRYATDNASSTTSPSRTLASNATSAVIVKSVAILDRVTATDRRNTRYLAKLFPGDRPTSPLASSSRNDQLEFLVIKLFQCLSKEPKVLSEDGGVGGDAMHDTVKTSTPYASGRRKYPARPTDQTAAPSIQQSVEFLTATSSNPTPPARSPTP